MWDTGSGEPQSCVSVDECVNDFLVKVGLWIGIDREVMSGIYDFVNQGQGVVKSADSTPGISQSADWSHDNWLQLDWELYEK